MDRALLARVRKQAWFHRYPRGVPLLLLAITGIGTVLSVMAIDRADTQREQLELERNFTEIASGLERRGAEQVALLRAAASLFATSEDVTKEEFTEFASDLVDPRQLRGSLGLGWARWLNKGQIPDFEASIRETDAADYFVHPAPRPSEVTAVPVVYLEPLSTANRKAIGYNMYSESTRRKAMNRAVDLELPVTSGKIHLVQDSDKPGAAGFLIYMPVFRETGGRRTIRGFVYSPLRAEEFLESAASLSDDRPVEFAIYDGSEGPDNLLAMRKLPGEVDLTMSQKITFGEREWLLRVSSKRSALSPLALTTLLFGTVLSLVLMFVGMLITRRAAEDRAVLEWLSRQSAIRDSLTRELNHRVKNTLANVLSIVSLTRRRSTDLDDFSESLTGRIRALSATHDLLSQSNWSDALLGEVVRNELAPYLQDTERHVEMSGPEVRLAPNDAMSLGLAIHELATNAAKYGALSTEEGKIFISWEMPSSDLVEINWREEGGPPVSQPSRRGFGRDLIEKIVAHELQSDVELDFHPEGVRCKLKVPVRKPLPFALRTTDDNRKSG